jgi:hypothetical protein
LFGRKLGQQKEQRYMGTITTRSKYEDMMKFLSDFVGSEFKLDEKVVPFFGIAYDGIAMDEKKICMLAPSPSNFIPPSEFEEISLDSLDMGVDKDGVAIVGFHRTIVKKKYVDGFVQAMRDVYNITWQEIQAWLHRKATYPILLTTSPWTFVIAPLVSDLIKTAWVKGKYDPEAKIVHNGDSCEDCAYSEGYLVEAPKPSFSSILLGMPDYEVREHWVCNKFHLNLDGRLGLAERCTSYLTQREYEQKCLSGKMERLKPVTVVECAYCGASYDIAKHPSCPVCSATLKKKKRN